MAIDEVEVMYDDSLTNTHEWKILTKTIEPGMKFIELIYEKYNSEENKDMMFEIKVTHYFLHMIFIVNKSERNRTCRYILSQMYIRI